MTLHTLQQAAEMIGVPVGTLRHHIRRAYAAHPDELPQEVVDAVREGAS